MQIHYKNNSCSVNKYAGYFSFLSLKRRKPCACARTCALFIKTKNTNNTGNIVWAASYDAFGKASIITQAATSLIPMIDSNLRLPGQYEDPETGLNYDEKLYGR